jgi:hypothetical protein
MGKGSSRRQFNKVSERAFKKHYSWVFKHRENPLPTSKTIYVLKGKDLVGKSN